MVTEAVVKAESTMLSSIVLLIVLLPGATMRYPIVLQHSLEDCGAASLATVAKYYGRTLTLV